MSSTCMACSSVRMALMGSSYRKSRTISSGGIANNGCTTGGNSISPLIRYDKISSSLNSKVLEETSVSSGRYLSSSSRGSHSLAISRNATSSTHDASSSCRSSSSINSHDKNNKDTMKAISSAAAVLAFMLGYVAATSSTASTTENSASITNSTTTKLNLKGGGGGGPGSNSSSSMVTTTTTTGKKAAEDDVRKVEIDAERTPYPISEGFEQGARWTMEDAYTVQTGGRFVGVFDGHGGSDVSTILQNTLFGYYRNILSSKHWEEHDDFDDPSRKQRIPSIASHVAALRGALEKVEEDVMKDDHLVYQGSTAVVVVVHVAEDGRRTLLSANIGDSRAILSRNGKAIDLTRDHKPNDEREKARIRAHGEDIEWDPYGEVYRVRDLSLSRVIGDRFAKPVVSNEAEIKHFPVHDDHDEFILLGSDGLFDVMESQEVIDFVHWCLEADAKNPDVSKDYSRQTMAKNVADEALERGTADNVCVIMVWLKDLKDS